MATVSNVNGQLEIVINDKKEYYQYVELSNLTWVLNNDGNYYIQLTFDADYFVKIKIADITNQPFWSNDKIGADQAVSDISSWIGGSVASAPSVVYPNVMRVSNNATLTGSVIYSLSVANVGAANGTFLGTTLKPGESLSFSAENTNFFPDGSFYWTASGTEFLIIYTIP